MLDGVCSLVWFVCCALLGARCLLPGVCSVLVVDSWVMFVALGLLRVVCYVLVDVSCSMAVGCCGVCVERSMLFVVRCLLFGV